MLRCLTILNVRCDLADDIWLLIFTCQWWRGKRDSRLTPRRRGSCWGWLEIASIARSTSFESPRSAGGTGGSAVGRSGPPWSRASAHWAPPTQPEVTKIWTSCQFNKVTTVPCVPDIGARGLCRAACPSDFSRFWGLWIPVARPESWWNGSPWECLSTWTVALVSPHPSAPLLWPWSACDMRQDDCSASPAVNQGMFSEHQTNENYQFLKFLSAASCYKPCFFNFFS